MNKYKIISWTAVILWMATIFFLSHQPGTQSSGLSSTITETIINAVEKISPAAVVYVGEFHTIVRKSAHFIAYLLLGMLSANALKASGVGGCRRLVSAFAISALYAISDEFHQVFIDGRSGEVRDVLIDSAGAMTGIAIYWAVGKLRFLRKTVKLEMK